MASRARLVLLLFGVFITVCALLALAYAFWPLEVTQVTYTIEPTLFVSP